MVGSVLMRKRRVRKKRIYEIDEDVFELFSRSLRRGLFG